MAVIAERDPRDRAALERAQRQRLARLLDEARRGNAFYRRKLAGVAFDPRHDSLDTLPLTTREEIQRDQAAAPPFGTNLTYPLERYTRFHQTSGTQGQPLRWLDTAESWEWWQACWRRVHAAADVSGGDRVAFLFSFGPFIGFWAAFESAASLGCLCLPAGGMSTTARLRYVIDNGVTVVCCTPTYGLHAIETAEREGIDLAGSKVRRLIVAGEPGGSIPAVRQRLEAGWGATVVDHAGATEMGAWGFQPSEQPGGLLVNESEFIAEVLDASTGLPVADGEPGELVLTNLGRTGSPLLRYRTGDVVRLTRGRSPHPCFAWLEGGVLGRADDMLLIRGNNVFPSAIEGILRELPEVAEFRLRVQRAAGTCELCIDVEPAGPSDAGLAERVAARIRDRLFFRPSVRLAAPGTLPRFEMKARRLVIEDGSA